VYSSRQSVLRLV